MRIKNFSRLKMGRNKNDQVDASLIAEYCAVFSPAPWTPASPAFKRFRELVRLREAIKTSLVQWKNRGKAGNLDEIAAAVIETIIGKLGEECERVECAIRETIKKSEILSENFALLTSIPAVGANTAAIVMAELPGPDVIRTAKEAAAYAGLSPCHNQSGSRTRPTHISRIGNGALRRALYLPALAAFRYNPIVKALRERLRGQRRLKPQQIAAAAMRKLLHLCFGVLKTRTPFNPCYCVNTA